MENIENLLYLLQKENIIDKDNVLEILMKSKKTQVLKMHPYKITPPASDKGRWQTYYKGDDGKRKILRAQTEKEIVEKLFSIYFSKSYLDNFIFYDLFQQWLEYKKMITSSPNTIKRHEQHYNRYFRHSALHDMKISEIDEIFLETECNRIVKEFNLTRKEWNNIKTILFGMFEYAERKHYLTGNLMEKVKIHVKFRQVVKKTGATQTYNTDELEKLNRYLDQMYMETGDSVFMAVKLNFLLGLRVGELVALRWEDITDKTHLHIVREETRNQYTNTYEVVEHTKTHQDRYVILVPKALEILEKIEKQGEYIFVKDGERIFSRQIAYVLEKYAERQGIATKSTHKMRKTYASRLNANGVPLDAIRTLLGHNSLSTTLEYIYNPLTETDTYNLISGAL